MKLVVENLKKSFEKKEVVKDINFEFEKGKIYGLLCIAYCLISLFLAYKYAPKTFKLRV